MLRKTKIADWCIVAKHSTTNGLNQMLELQTRYHVLTHPKNDVSSEELFRKYGNVKKKKKAIEDKAHLKTSGPFCRGPYSNVFEDPYPFDKSILKMLGLQAYCLVLKPAHCVLRNSA